MVGSYANLRPDNPETFITSIAAVLAQYPLGIAEEAADPRTGVARKVEFLSVKSIVEWCDARLTFYRSLASYIPIPPKLPPPELTPEQVSRGAAAMRGLHRALVEKRDLRSMSVDDCIDLGGDAA